LGKLIIGVSFLKNVDIDDLYDLKKLINKKEPTWLIMKKY